ncbi:PilZ domain-containing protein [Endozoicomonas sp. G2_1]|uniref:PilZ domain-containing protein n=1 Tax=Endozoicomonas sp. G2_1 TaxID=2821091 RepID=UPI001ADB03BB|nr:PilZ domain-containing protein [Endozoicomonas sp. G2_1]MBO9489986.1 PilZ domain-containing protein [Endozoicomonas sp. G2_1]
MSDELYSDDDERRQSFRLDMEKELIDLSWQDAEGHVQVKKTACLDFARGGIKVDCDQSIEVGTEVAVTFKAHEAQSQRLSAQVIRCALQDNGWYHIALQTINRD